MKVFYIELKYKNKIDIIGEFLVKSEDILCESKIIHKGRTTQVWDATVFNPDNKKKIALTRCTQFIFNK